jgi:hypothetical protein
VSRVKKRAPRTAALAACALLVVGATTLALAPQRGDGDLPDLGSRRLRAEVNRLKREIAVEPTTAANVVARVEVLWPWANALGRAGVVIPVDLPLNVALVRWSAADGGEPELPPGLDLPLAVHVQRVDQYLRELALKEDQPRALGELRFVREGALVSSTITTIEQTYTVGEAAVLAGGGFLVAKTWVADELRLQNRDPAAPNFVTARASRAGVELQPITVPWIGVHGSTRGPEPLPAFRVAGASLEPGDVVTFVLGSTAGGSPGMKVPTYSVDRFLVPVYVDLDGSRNFMTPVWPELEVVGAPEVANVRLLAPSTVAAGEPFSLTVRSEDRAMNRASGGVPGYELRRFAGRGEGVRARRETQKQPDDVLARLPAGGEGLARIDGLTVAEPGITRFEIRSADGRLAAVSNPIAVEAAPRHRVFWGETHGHTSMAEGQGSPRGFFDYARDDARLDFVTLSEHDIWMHDAEWSMLQDLTREFSQPRRGMDPARERPFVAILGYEWSGFRNRGGHHNVFFRRPNGPLVPVHDAMRLDALYDGLRRRSRATDVLVIPHAHEAGDWNRSDGELERLVELYSTHGSFEWFANRYLRNGFEVGMVGASDDHGAKPGLAPGPLIGASQPGGLTAALAPALDRDAIFDALRARSVYATSGPRILLAATLNGRPMGERQPDSARRDLEVRVSGTSPIERIDLVRNGEVVLSRPFARAPLAPHLFLQVEFESSSEVFGREVLNPRGYRTWKGTLEVEGARLLGVRPVGLDHPLRESAAIVAGSQQRVSFEVLTRGRADSLLLELDGVSPATVLRLTLEPTRGTSSVSSLLPGADIPGTELRLTLAGLRDNTVEHELRAGDDVDRIRLQAVDPDAPLDRELSYSDLDGGPGDYYYVRVTQLDGGRAWSSPFWVGRRP